MAETDFKLNQSIFQRRFEMFGVSQQNSILFQQNFILSTCVCIITRCAYDSRRGVGGFDSSHIMAKDDRIIYVIDCYVRCATLKLWVQGFLKQEQFIAMLLGLPDKGRAIVGCLQ